MVEGASVFWTSLHRGDAELRSTSTGADSSTWVGSKEVFPRTSLHLECQEASPFKPASSLQSHHISQPHRRHCTGPGPPLQTGSGAHVLTSLHKVTRLVSMQSVTRVATQSNRDASESRQQDELLIRVLAQLVLSQEDEDK